MSNPVIAAEYEPPKIEEIGSFSELTQGIDLGGMEFLGFSSDSRLKRDITPL